MNIWLLSGIATIAWMLLQKKNETVSPSLEQKLAESRPQGLYVTYPLPLSADGSYQLLQGGRYLLEFELTGLAAMFGTAEDIVEKLTEAGAKVDTIKNLGGDRWRVIGTWMKPSATVSLPSAIKLEKISRMVPA